MTYNLSKESLKSEHSLFQETPRMITNTEQPQVSKH